ncbi:hypothetical protein LCGC14_1641940 [marine sediment metagenome]|uniref:Uncharacterized protein n=1 Tax=marine sediment metagenome TaxID=412755 RepID=A0A0F9KZ24_9ZZZZ
MNVFQLAYLQLQREGKAKQRNFGSLFVNRAVKIRDFVIKNKVDIVTISECALRKFEDKRK